VAALQWIIDNTPECKKVTAQIPVIYDNVRRFIEQFGFVQEGINRQSYQKAGKILDQWNYGITRPEIEAFLNE